MQKLSAREAIGIVVLAAILGGGYFASQAKQEQALADVPRQVLRDTVRQYDTAKRDGTAMDACVQAGLVKAAALQAHDDATFRRFVEVERADCAAAGAGR